MSQWNEKTVRQRLGEAAKRLHIGISQTQLLLCQDRFLARLARLKAGKSFVWKGGSLVLRRYSKIEIPRYTVDVDLLALGIQISDVESVFKEAMAFNLSDGFQFTGITKAAMERDTPYGGDRYEIGWHFFGREGSESLKIDVCAGDDVDPTELQSKEAFLIDDETEKISLLVYPPEFVFAEKLETMVRFKTGNTRLKDFIDMWTLIQLPLDPKAARKGIERCFARRATPLKIENIEKILKDQAFVSIMERAQLKRYPQLKLPTMEIVFEDINRFVTRALKA